MQIPPPALKVTLASPRPTGLDWQVGQLLDARVLRSAPAGESVQIRVGNMEVSVRLPQNAAEGSRLTLQVVRAGAQPILALVDRASAPAATLAQGAAAQPAVSTATPAPSTPWLSNLLPAQGSQVPLLSALWSLQQQPGRLAELPAPVRKELEQLFRQLPGVEQATRPEGLRQAVQTSGIFHEANLAATALSGTALPAANLKSVLLSLATRLRTLPGNPAPPGVRSPDIPPPQPGSSPAAQARMEANLGQLGRDALLDTLRSRTESAVARLALHQWSSAEAPDSGMPRWLMELPLRSGNGIDLIHLLLEREPDRPEQEDEAVWRAEFALDLPELGPLHIRIAVSGDRVRTRFWAQDADTVARIRSALPRLYEALENRDLEVRDLGCNEGKPPARSEPAQRRPLLDDHA
ncbi:MAG: flagellar hook-length control protein FliK [Thioalkalivibrio sp.]